GREGLRPLAVAAAGRKEGPVRARLRALALVGAVMTVTALAVWSCFVIVDVTEYGLILRFGRVVRVIREPGLYLKRPYPLESVVRLDRRLLIFSPVTAEFLSDNKKNLVIHSLVTWRITDPERFLATTADPPTAEQRISDLVLTKIGSVVGSHPSTALVSVEGHPSQFDQVMRPTVAGGCQGHAHLCRGLRQEPPALQVPPHAPGLREDSGRQHDDLSSRRRRGLPAARRRGQADEGQVAVTLPTEPHELEGGSVASPHPSPSFTAHRRAWIGGVAACAVAIYVLTGIFTVAADQQAVIRRFGRVDAR